jgi:uncharacterized protein (DUF2126 family)/transglutaminase-like putative cysteine protease
MAIRVALHHRSQYSYDRYVTLLPQVVRLRPAPHCRTPILSYSLKVQPASNYLNWQQDPYSNYQARLVFPKPVKEFSVEVDLIAEMTTINPFDFFVEASAEKYPFAYDPLLAKELAPYLEALPPGPTLHALLAELRHDDPRTIDYLVEINSRLQKMIGYIVRLEPGIQTCEETLTNRSGSCRDSAWLLVQVLRHLGLAARFASGYLVQLTADVKSLDGASGPEHDFTDLHAWAEVYLPGAGWIGLDPTSGLLTGEGHIPLACAADPTNAAPITGTFNFDKDPAKEDDKVADHFQFSLSLTRIHEDPRVTKPYTDEQWQEIEELGHRVDQKLLAADVRLTMGGEPTFVSIDDRDGDEWNTASLGPLKRERSGQLLRRLRDRFAPGALLHFGQGKWYPGEALPRWSLACYWRRDGVPVWNNPALIAEDSHDYGCTVADAERFISVLASRLEIDPSFCIPGYEDVWQYLLRERRLPINVDPLKNQLDDPQERARLARIFEQGLGKVVGFALPLRRDGSRWTSGRWHLRRERLYLIPGDSPMGLRLPLDSLPYEAPDKRDTVVEPDPSIPREPLPPRNERYRQAPIQGHRPSETTMQQSAELDATGKSSIIRTTLCAEPRQGRLFVFMPPQTSLEDYLDLVEAVEATAALLGMPVQVEGYEPPRDPRLIHFRITPDPGVIEVNVHPSSSWDELVETTTVLYEEAHQSRLTTEKFMVDGRHTGTGGGNHIVVGGATTLDSPFLRRPDLLRSLVAYWHNHPSLSYIFSGLFVGPTSQAPRIDEARNDSLYEMELAFGQIPERGPVAPWLVDRVFRNLLVDVTGNTHRAEFCIDKLYSPDSASGRLGLVEMRAFEMPPHARMSLTQQLLLRALIARFWDHPYRHKLVRWGTTLHDRFMLPHFVQEDFLDVLADLQSNGYPLRKQWFAPHFEFRFPFVGSVAHRSASLELRLAIEPWHVLGEESTTGGTARYVDSSVERLQVKVKGMIDPRHIVTCNGRRVPLHPTGTSGEFVSGVRYRAWQPPNALHPTIGIHSPLVFDILDTWQERSLGGCVYHVVHPGGRSYDTLPVNANEAESRRMSRFFVTGHTPGPMTMPLEETSSESPLTLDLRRPLDEPAPLSRKPALTEPANGRLNGIWLPERNMPGGIPEHEEYTERGRR